MKILIAKSVENHWEKFDPENQGTTAAYDFAHRVIKWMMLEKSSTEVFAEFEGENYRFTKYE